MRILFVSHYFPPAHTAGTETYAYNLARRLKKRNTLLVFHTEKRLARPQYGVLAEAVDGIDVRVLVNNLCHDHFGETYSNPRAEAAFEAVLDDFQPDVVHVHHLMYSSLKLPVLAKERGAAVVMTLHDFFLMCPRGGRLMTADGQVCPGPEGERCAACLSTFKYRQRPWEKRMISVIRGAKNLTGLDFTGIVYTARDRIFKRDLGAGIIGPAPGDPKEAIRPRLDERDALVRRLFEAVDLFMTPSNTVGEAMKSCGLPAGKLEHWKYGIDLDPFESLERPSRERPVFGYFGTLMPHKGVHVFVEAAAKLAPGAVKTLVRGAASQNPRYTDRLKRMAGPDTVFRDAFPRSGVREAFSEIDVVVLPSLWLENSPVVIQEAHAAGCPVVASDLGGMRELVKDGVNGRLFPPGDAGALAAILGEAGRDPGVVAAWREGIEPPRSIENDAAALEALYGRLIG